jgi:hypothetical protein
MLEGLAHSNIGHIPRSHSWIEILIGKGVKIEELKEGDLHSWARPISVPAARMVTIGTIRDGQLW